MLRIRLKRLGAKKRPFYRIVVAESRKPRQGRSVKELGWYDPLTNPARVKLDLEAYKSWIAKGAKPSETVAALAKKVEKGELGVEAPPAPQEAAPEPEPVAVAEEAPAAADEAASAEAEPEPAAEAAPAESDSAEVADDSADEDASEESSAD